MYICMTHSMMYLSEVRRKGHKSLSQAAFALSPEGVCFFLVEMVNACAISISKLNSERSPRSGSGFIHTLNGI